MLIHRFVYECFKENIPDGLEIDHIDNNKHNNHIDNLQAITHKENMQKMSRDRKCKVLPTPTLLATCLNTGQQESFVDVFVASEKLKIDFRDILLFLINRVEWLLNQQLVFGLHLRALTITDCFSILTNY